MLISWLGGTSIGLVWGWTVGRLIGQPHRSLADGLTIGMGMILLSIQIRLLTDWRSLVLFFGGTMLALFIHLEWLRKLRRARIGRFGTPE